MDVTIAVIPRERFRPLPTSLRSLFATIPPTVRVLVVDCGADEKTRQALKALQQERDFELVLSEKFLLPNMARNLALDKAHTRYVAFCDNDLTYSPGWAEALIANAEAHNAAAVSPVTLIGPSSPEIIHHAGGKMMLVEDDSGKVRLRRRHRLGRVRLPDAEESDFREAGLEHDYFEYHCVLVDAQAMRSVGGHDERLVMHEHEDSSLRLRAAGHKITFESSARVMYNAFERFQDEDWPYFLYRWSVKKADVSNQVFAENWGIDEKSGFAEFHRGRAMKTVLPRLPRVLDRNRVRQVLLRLCERRISKFDPGLDDEPNVRTLERPGADELQRTHARLERM